MLFYSKSLTVEVEVRVDIQTVSLLNDTMTLPEMKNAESCLRMREAFFLFPSLHAQERAGILSSALLHRCLCTECRVLGCCSCILPSPVAAAALPSGSAGDQRGCAAAAVSIFCVRPFRKGRERCEKRKGRRTGKKAVSVMVAGRTGAAMAAAPGNVSRCCCKRG